MSHTPVGGHPQGWEGKLADRSSLPPVPGEERGRPPALYSSEHAPHLHRYYGSSKGPAPSVPRRISAPYGGSGGGGGSGAKTPSTPPAYLRWARSLHDLLEDPEGVRLFQWFVREAGAPHADRLDFYFACQGLKQQWDPPRLKSMVAAIYNFTRKSQLTIPEDVRRKIKRGLKEEEDLDVDIFDSMQAEVEALIKETTYLSFLRSDAYLQAAQASQSSQAVHTSSSGSLSSSSSAKELCAANLSPLATLHEGEELSLQHHQPPPSSSSAPPSAQPQRLTKELLMATQKRRLQTETLRGGVFGRNYSVYSQPHLSYTAYCPASRQDSELQSMSSGRTDSDALSMSGSSIDGVSVCRGTRGAHGARREHLKQLRSIMESANINKDTRVHDMVIPRTFRIQKGQCSMMKPEEFAPLLIEKLERVKRDQDNQEKLDRKLMENEDEGQTQPRLVAAALREKLQLDDDNDQDILDQHVSRVWSDLTPARSPGRPPTPPPYGRKMHPRELHSRGLHSTLSAQSALSADSGNVRDFGDVSSNGTTSVGKSRSVPDYRDLSFPRDPLERRCMSRKALTDLTDSGVSVVSDTPPVLPAHQPHSRVLLWIQKGASSADRYGRRSFSRSGSAERPGQPVATDPQMPPLPSPHTPTQLDEARRRLEQQQQLPRHTKRSNVPIGKAPAPPPPLESFMPPPPPLAAPSPFTVVVFTFLEEQFPYRTKIPAAPVTLKQFKEYLPKKGNYRYFFKTQCEELENTVIQEEIFNDSDFLPLWDGKIMARVKNVE